MDFDHKGIFQFVTNNTDEVIILIIQKVDGGERPLLRELYDHVVKNLKKVRGYHQNLPQLNFESLLHVIEMYIAYSGSWHKEYISWLALPEFGTLIQPDDFLKDIQPLYLQIVIYQPLVN